MAPGRIPWPLVVLLLADCRSEAPARTENDARAVLADSVRFENELIGVGYLRRVAVHTTAGVDTIDGIVTEREPVVVGDSVVHGLSTISRRSPPGSRMSHSVGGGAQRIRGDVSALGSTVVDTIGR